MVPGAFFPGEVGGVMDGMFSIAAFILLIGLIVLVILMQQFQQNRQYAEIQARLREIRDAELREQRANALRAERLALLDPINILEATVQSRGKGVLSDDELIQIESARTRVKAITEELMSNQQWLGPPFDLEWHEALERLPLIRAAFLAANFAPPNAEIAAPHGPAPQSQQDAAPGSKA